MPTGRQSATTTDPGSVAPGGRGQVARRSTALALVAALIASMLVLFAFPPAAQAADRLFLIDSLDPKANDAAIGDGICRTAAGTCTLRAALQEANALPVTDTITISPADGFSGTITNSGNGTADRMYSGVISSEGDNGAYYLATRPVVLDFQNRLGMQSSGDGDLNAAFYINGPGVQIRNFQNIKSAETAFIFGPNANGSVVENGTCIDPGSINLERCFYFFGNGATNTTIRNVEMGSTYSGGGAAVMFGATSTVYGVTFDRVRMYAPDTEGYYGYYVPAGAVVDGLVVTGSTFETFQTGYEVFLVYGRLTNARISGNTFRNINNTDNVVYITRQGAANVIEHNTFTAGTGATRSYYALVFISMGLAATADSGWAVRENSFDGFQLSTVYVAAGAGILPVERNTFGLNSYGGATVANEADSVAVLYNGGTTANQGIRTWYPTAVSLDGAACTLTVNVTPATVAPIPATPVTVDVYYTATNKAEVYLGGRSGLTAAGPVTVPYTGGTGNIRVQTTAPNGATSQYSRTVALTQPSPCGPTVTLNQAAGQADPTSVRDIQFTMTLSEPTVTAVTPGAFAVAGSTATNARVTAVTPLSTTSYRVTARADGSGTVVLSLPAGRLLDADGNGNSASTSTDNEVTYTSPLTLTPTGLTVTEGAPGQTYDLAKTIAATAPVVVTPAVGNPAWATVAPSPLTLPTTATSVSATVTAVDDSVHNGTRTTQVTHVVASTDPNFDGLVLEPVAVTVLDNDAPDAGQSRLTVSTGTRIAGSGTHTATATIRNAAGAPVDGITVTFGAQAPATVGAPSCVTNSSGVCSVTVASQAAGAFEVRAFLDGTTALTDSPGTVRFVAGPPSTETSTITASALTLPADGESTSTVTVRLFDALGNSITSGGATVTTATTGGTLGPVTDHGDGTYTAVLTAPTAVGSATVSYAVGGAPGARSVTIRFVAGEASPSTSTIAADPTGLVADGTATATLTVTLLDGYGNPVGTGGDTVAFTSALGTVGPVTDHGDGTYTATYTAGTVAGADRVGFSVDGVVAPATATLTLTAGEPDPTTSTFTSFPASITADGVSQSALTVTLLDAHGNRVTGFGGTVEIRAPGGETLTATVAGGDGTYTALVTAPRSPGLGTFEYALDGTTQPTTATVRYIVGHPDADATDLAASPTEIPVGGARSTITVTVRDAAGNVVTDPVDVALSTTAGTLGTVSGAGDGTYTATLTSGEVAATATVSLRVGGVLSASTVTVTFVPGPASPATSTIVAAPTSVPADGLAGSALTVTLRDAFGNPLTAGGAVVALATTAGSVGGVLDRGDGTYAAFLTSSTTAGTATVSFTVNGGAASSTAEVVFAAGPVSADASTLVTDRSTLPADGTSTATVTVTLRDAHGNPTGTAGRTVAISTSAGSITATSDAGDGTYTAVLTSATAAATATLGFALDGTTAAPTTTVRFLPGAADLATSTITAAPTTLTADGTSTSTVTVQLRDAHGNDLAGSGGTVVIATTTGTISPVTDHGDGSYTATLTAPTTAGTATLSFTVAGDAAQATATVTVVPGPVDLGASTITAERTVLVADGESSTDVTVTLRDVHGNPVGVGGADVSLATTAGDLSGVVDHGDGTYGATLTAPVVAGRGTLSYVVDGADGDRTLVVTFVPGEASPARSTITADPASITADGVSTSTVTVTVLDAYDNPLGIGGADVTVDTTAGTLSAVTDHGDGTYTAVLTSATTAGTATVSFAVDGDRASAEARVDFVAGSADAGSSQIVVSPTSITADGVSTSAVTVTLLDAQGNRIRTGGAAVGVTTTLGTLGPVTDHGDGTYTADLTSSTSAGSATVGFTLDGADAPATAAVEFVAGTPSAGTSAIDAAPPAVTADGVDASTVTVTLADAFGNRITQGGAAVVLTPAAGSVGPVTDHGDGTYSAPFTSTVAGVVAVGFAVDGVPATAAASVTFRAGPGSAPHSTIAADPPRVPVATGTATVTVTVRDAFGNATAGGDGVELQASAGVLDTVTDRGDGTYTAVLTAAQTAGTATITFTVNGTRAPGSATVEFAADTPSPDTSRIAAAPASITADGAAVSTVTVTLVDAFGNPLLTGGAVVAMATTAGSLGPVTDHGDGTYTAALTATTQVGAATVSFTVDGAPAAATADVVFVAGAPSPATSEISADPVGIVANGTATSTVTVRLLDAYGNPVPSGGALVALATDRGSVGAVTDRGDGTYTGVLVAGTTAGTATVSFTVDGTPAASTAEVAFVPGPAAAATSTVVAQPSTIDADGVSTSTVVVTLRDAFGNALTSGGAAVVPATTAGTLGPVTDHGDGTYTAVLTSAATAGVATVSFTVDGAASPAGATVRFVAGAASAATSTIAADPTSITADGAATSTVTVTLRDAQGNALTASGGTVVVTTSAGTLTPAVDRGDGTYTAELTAPTVSGTAELRFTVNGAAAESTALVDLVPGPIDLTRSTIEADASVLVADGVAATTVRVTLRDAQGNPVGVGGADVAMEATAGTLDDTVDHGDGTYTTTLTAPTAAGSGTVTYTVGGDPGAESVVVTFVAGVASPARSTVVADPASITADGSATSTVTVTLRDAYDNPVGAGSALVAMTTTAGSLGPVTDHGDGTFTAVLTSATSAGTATVRFTVDGATATARAEVAFVAGAPDPGSSTIVASPTTVTADGVSTSAVTVALLDVHGNRLTAGGAAVTMGTTAGSLGPVSDNGDGTYTATLLAPTVASSATVSFAVDGAPASATTQVTFVAGPADVGRSTITADPTSITADGASTAAVTVTLVDAQGNPLTSSGPAVAMATTAGSLGPVTDHGDGTYGATLTSGTLATAAEVRFTVGGLPASASAQVVFVPGAADPARSTIAAAPSSITADGAATSTVTVRLVDAEGNALTAAAGTVTMATTAGSLGPVTSNGDGSYSAVLISATLTGTATVSFAVDGIPGAATTDVAFVAGPVDPTTSTIAAAPSSITADGVSSSVVTVTLLDAHGNRVTAGASVTLATTAGTLSGQAPQGDGTVTATLRSATTAGTAMVSFVVDGAPGTATADVAFTPGAAAPGRSTIAAAPTSITADGAATSTVTVRLVDAFGNALTSSGGTVTMSATAGTLGAVTDHADGTYTAELTAATAAGTATVSFAVDDIAAPATAAVVFVPGTVDLGSSTIGADALELVADGVAGTTVTVTLRDAQGNPVGVGGADVAMATTSGSLSGVVDHGDGRYTATLTAPTAAGEGEVSYTVGGSAGERTVTIAFVAGTASPSLSRIAADPVAVTADGASASTVTVTLVDGFDNPVPTGGAAVTMATTAGSLGAVTDHGDGTYTATLTSATTAGTATVSFTVGGAAASATASVTFTAGDADPGTSTITASPTSITADGTSTSAVTVVLRDAYGNPLTASGGTVTMATTAGSLGAVTDHGDGTYTAVLTSATTAGTATVSFTVNAAPASATASVTFTAGDADPGTSTIGAAPPSITADGVSMSVVTVALADVHGNPLTASGGTVTMATTAGSLGAVTDHGDGTYTAVLTSATTAGTATVSFTVNAAPASATASVTFTAGDADPGTSTITATPTSITADGISTSTVTMTLYDVHGNRVPVGGDTVEPGTTAGTLGPVSDRGDGTYTATLTAPTAVGSATVSFAVNGTAADATATIDFTPGTADAGRSEITADPASITADGTSTSAVTVVLRDAYGNPLTASGGTVTMATTAGSLGAVTDHGDGTYTATLTSATTAGTATLSFTVNGSLSAATASVAFTAGDADAGTSAISASPTSITADGTSTSAVTVVLRDAYGNPLTTGGTAVTMATTAGTLDTVTDHGDGTYTAVLTSATTATTATVSFTVNAAPATATASVTFTAGAADPGTSTIAAAPTSITADGTSMSAVTVRLHDVHGNPLTASGGTVTMATTAGTLDTVTDHGDGTYTAVLTSATTATTATVSFTVNAAPATATAEVRFTPDAADPGASTITAAPTSITADGVSTSTVTVTLRDAHGNPLTTGGTAVTMATTAGTLDTVADHGDGTYTAVLTSATTTGPATVSFTVDGDPATASATVAFAPGAADAETSTIAAAPTSITADGVSTSTVTVTLRDAHGNPLAASGGAVTMATTAGVLSPVTDHGDGTYTAALTSDAMAGTATVSFAVNGTAAEATTQVAFLPGDVSLATSTIDASVTVLEADGSSTTTITVTLRDAHSNPVGSGGADVAIGSTAGALGPVTDHGDGTYTAVLTAPTLAQEATVSYTVDGTAGERTLLVTFVAGVASPARSTIAADPTSITADGVATSTVTVTLLDAFDNPVGASGGTVTMTATAGSLGPVTDRGDGTFTAVLTAPTTAGQGIVSFTVDGHRGAREARIAYVPGPPSAARSTISATPDSLVAGSGATSTVTVVLLDAEGNRIPSGAADVSMAATAGSLGPVTDHGDGTYTALLVAGATPGSATVTFTLDGADADASAVVRFVVGPPDPDTSTIVATPPQIEADGTAESVVTVTLRDAQGSLVVEYGPPAMSATLGTLGVSVDQGDGTHTAVLTAPPTPGTGVVSFAVDGVFSPETAEVVFVDTTAPDPPVLTGPPGPVTGPLPVFTGAGEPGATLTVFDHGGNPLCATVVGPNGSWSCTPALPLSVGPLEVTAVQIDASGNVSGASTPLSLTVVGTPWIDLSSATVPRGGSVVVTGRGFVPGERVSGVVNSTPFPLGTLVAAADGTVAFTVQVPVGFDLGVHEVRLTGELSGGVSATLTVVDAATEPAPAPTPPPGPAVVPPEFRPGGGALPWTGTEPGPALGLVGLLLTLGVGLLLWRRRRRRSAVEGPPPAPA